MNERKALICFVITMAIFIIMIVIYTTGAFVPPIAKSTPFFYTPEPTIYKAPTPTNTKVLIYMEITPGKITVIETLPTTTPDILWTPEIQATANVPQIQPPVDVKELEIYDEIKK